MKITAGLGSIEDYPLYVQAGADEVFAGYVPYSWNLRYGNVYPLNRREVLYYLPKTPKSKPKISQLI